LADFHRWRVFTRRVPLLGRLNSWEFDNCQALWHFLAFERRNWCSASEILPAVRSKRLADNIAVNARRFGIVPRYASD